MLAPPKIYAFVVLGAWGTRNTVVLKQFQNCQPQNSRNTVLFKKNQKSSQILASTARPGADSFQILEFFEHYSVSWVLRFGNLHFEPMFCEV